tara:strand:+ start:22 stop:492 length:471 start_codon:yes stop_codon:yes gene_type:complete
LILISHRGNISGSNLEKENHPDYIRDAISKGYEVEIDLRRIDDNWYLGHDEPQYIIKERFLDTFSSDLWVHLKNIEALEYLTARDSRTASRPWNYFWHQEDDYALTSWGFIWTYPGKKLTNRSICVLPELTKCDILLICAGVCSDHIGKYKNEKDI